MRFYNGRIKGNALEQIAEAMGLTADKESGNRIADAVAEMNAKIGLPSTVRKMGYDKTDIGQMVQDSCESHFNFSAPIRPNADEYEKIVIEVLG
jgi:4-hydroxybutyrate dehydrogenase